MKRGGGGGKKGERGEKEGGREGMLGVARAAAAADCNLVIHRNQRVMRGECSRCAFAVNKKLLDAAAD